MDVKGNLDIQEIQKNLARTFDCLAAVVVESGYRTVFTIDGSDVAGEVC